jgi:hypothetical protein
MYLTFASSEVAGTAGAFASSSAISRFGNNYSFFMTPVFFAFAGVCIFSSYIVEFLATYMINSSLGPLSLLWAIRRPSKSKSKGKNLLQ